MKWAGNDSPTIERTLQCVGIGVWKWDVGTGEVNYSDAWKHLRCRLDEDAGRSIEDSLRHVHSEDQKRLTDQRASLVDGQADESVCEYRVQVTDGSWIWVEERASVVRDENGSVRHVLGCEIDVTKRKQAELELKESEQQYAAIAESVPVGINRFEGQDCVYSSQGWEDLTGYPAEAALGDGWFKVIHPDDVPSVMELRRKSMTGPPNEEVIVHDESGRILKADGTEKFYEAKMRLRYGPDGQMVSGTAILFDVTDRKKLEREQERLNALVEATPDFVGFASAKREILFLNRSARERFPFLDPNDLPDFVGCYPDWAQKITLEEAIPQAIEHGTWSGELAFVGPDGKEIPVSQVLIAHRNASGILEGFSTIARDISDRKLAEQGLRESERAFASLAAAAPVAIVRMDKDLEHSYVNERWSEFTNRPTEAAHGKRWMEAVHPDDLPRILKTISEFAEDETRAICEPYEARHLHPDGSVDWILVHLAKEFDEDGNVQGYVGTLSDISSIKRDEALLKDVNRRLHAVLQCSSIGVWEWSIADEKLTWDEQMFEIYGVDPDEFHGVYADWLERLHPDDLERATKLDNCRLESDGNAAIEFRIVRPSGEVRHIYSNVFMEKDASGIPVRTTGVNMDITEHRNAELALRESENKFQRISEHLPGMIYRYIVHPDGREEVTYVSSGAREVFEIEPDDALAEGIHLLWERTHKDDRGWLGEGIAVSGEKLEPFLHEYRLQLPKKGLRWVQAFAQPVRVETGAIIWDGIILDNTERKTAQLQLQDARAKLEGVAENVPGMVWRMGRTDDGYAITYLSSKSREMFEIEPEEALEDGEALRQYIHPDDLEPYVTEQRRAIRNEQPFSLEFRILLPKQGLRWRQCVAHPVKSDSGEIVWNGMTLDITDQKMTQLALQDFQSRFQRISENLPGMICRYELNSDGTHGMSYVNSQVRDLFEVDPEAAIKNADLLFEKVHPEDLPKLRDAIRTSRKIQQRMTVEFRVNLPERGLRWLQGIGQPEQLACGSTIWDGVVIDVTERKQAGLQLQHANEELAHATKMKDRFLANMSHELRTPLNAILGVTEGLQEGILGPVTAKQKDGFEVIQQSGYHLLDLINEVLDLAKVESGFTELEYASVSVKGLCESGLQMVAQQASKKGVQLNLNVQFNLPDFEADPKRLRQVLVNLLSNAVKFTPNNGAVSIEARRITSRTIQDYNVLQIVVKDNGIGIADEDLDSLFMPFIQVDSSLSRNYEGTGLGLTLVKRFVELHAGRIRVESVLGEGSSFVVELPYREVADSGNSMFAGLNVHDANEIPTQDEQASDAASTRQSAKTVLLAEDNESVAKATTMYLESAHLTVLRASHGDMAIKVARENHPDLVLMDIQMPGMDGFQAIKRVREIPGMKDTPIIALTGLAMPADASRCLEAGANEYVSKPCPMSELVETIERLLSE